MKAELSNQGMYTMFTSGDCTITFRTPENLIRYTEILEWDHGYLVVKALYTCGKVEEYIDLIPILDHLYMDADGFLNPITEVVIENV